MALSRAFVGYFYNYIFKLIINWLLTAVHFEVVEGRVITGPLPALDFGLQRADARVRTGGAPFAPRTPRAAVTGCQFPFQSIDIFALELHIVGCRVIDEYASTGLHFQAEWGEVATVRTVDISTPIAPTINCIFKGIFLNLPNYMT